MWEEPHDPEARPLPIVFAMVVFAMFLGGRHWLGGGLQWLAVGAFVSAVAGALTHSRLERLAAEAAEAEKLKTANHEFVQVQLRFKAMDGADLSGIWSLTDLLTILNQKGMRGNFVVVHHKVAMTEIKLPLEITNTAASTNLTEPTLEAIYRLGEVISACRLRACHHEERFHILSTSDHPLLKKGTVAEQAELLENLNCAVQDYGLTRELSVAAPLRTEDFILALDEDRITLSSDDIVIVLAPADPWPTEVGPQTMATEFPMNSSNQV